MLGLIALAGLFIGGFALFAVFGLIFLIFKVVLWAVFFPIRLLMKLLWIPFALIGGLVSLVAGAALLPVLVIGALLVAAIAAVGAVLALLIPALPFILLGFVIWSYMRTRPVTA